MRMFCGSCQRKTEFRKTNHCLLRYPTHQILQCESCGGLVDQTEYEREAGRA